jgi:parallel beta-helix repeat protein
VASAQADPPLFVSNPPTLANTCASWATACSLSKALFIRGILNAQIRVRAGVYNIVGNDQINPNGLLAANDNGVVIRGGFFGATTLKPGGTCVGNGIVDFTPANNVKVERLTVNSTGSTCGSPVYNNGGVNDTLGALPGPNRVLVRGGPPAIAVNLVGGSTTLDNVRVQPAPAYTNDGISCMGASTVCTVTNSRIIGGTATTGIMVSSGATATVTTSTISNNGGGGVVLEDVTGAIITNNTITGTGPGITLVGSDNNTISNNVVDGVYGIYVGGNDITGPSNGSTISNNNFNNNDFGAVADGYGSAETWNRPGTTNQGIQGDVFFQSSVALGLGAITSVCPAADLSGSYCEVDTPAGMGSPIVTFAYSGVAAYLDGAGKVCPTTVTVDTPNATLYACTDGSGDIFLSGSVSAAISAGNGEATGSSTTTEPGCEASPPSNTAQMPCTGTVLTLSALPYLNTVASGNTFSNNTWSNELLLGAIDGSGPYGEAPPSGGNTYVDGNPSTPVSILNTWTGNVGSPTASACNPATGPVPPGPGPECGT